MLHNPHQRPNQLQDVGEFGVVSSNPGGRVGFSTDEPKPPLTAPIGLEARNWLSKRVDLAKKSLALNTNCEETLSDQTNSERATSYQQEHKSDW